jgi:hypothetical protein
LFVESADFMHLSSLANEKGPDDIA